MGGTGRDTFRSERRVNAFSPQPLALLTTGIFPLPLCIPPYFSTTALRSACARRAHLSPILPGPRETSRREAQRETVVCLDIKHPAAASAGLMKTSSASRLKDGENHSECLSSAFKKKNPNQPICSRGTQAFCRPAGRPNCSARRLKGGNRTLNKFAHAGLPLYSCKSPVSQEPHFWSRRRRRKEGRWVIPGPVEK